MDTMPTFHLLSTFTKWVLWSGKLVGIQRTVSGTCSFFKVLNSLGENSTGIKGHSFFLITWERGPASFLMAIAIICENIPTWIECSIVSQNTIASASHRRRIPERYLCELPSYFWVFCQTTGAHQLVTGYHSSTFISASVSSLIPISTPTQTPFRWCQLPLCTQETSSVGLAFPSQKPQKPMSKAMLSDCVPLGLVCDRPRLLH